VTKEIANLTKEIERLKREESVTADILTRLRKVEQKVATL